MLSTNTFTWHFQKSLEHSQTLIPTFAAKLIGQLSEIRRSNGDLFFTSCIHFSDHDSFIKYCKTVELFLLELDFISIFPTIGSRFRDNSIPKDKIRIFFEKIYKSVDICDVISIFITELNWICKASSRDIDSVPASKIYHYVFVINQDSRIYGFRNYRTSGGKYLIFNSEIEFHSVHAFISSLFIEHIYTEIDNEYFKVETPGMFDSTITFDLNFDQICQSYLSTILTFYNKSGPTGSGDTSPNNRLNSKTKNLKVSKFDDRLLSNGSAAFPTGSRSYSSNSRNNERKMDYSAQVLINGQSVSFSFSSAKAMVKFLNDYFNRS